MGSASSSSSASVETGLDRSPVLSSPAGAGRQRVVRHAICGYSPNRIPAYSNLPGTGPKRPSDYYVDGIFMGYRWQCVEYARRWLWLTKGLLLPLRLFAFRYKGLSYVTQPQVKAGPSVPLPPYGLPSRIADVPDPNDDGYEARAKAQRQRVKSNRNLVWVRVPCVFVSQGTAVPPIPDSLIIYPFTFRNMTGHIGVITRVDVDNGFVCVADQNRYFTPWVHPPPPTSLFSGDRRLEAEEAPHSAVFRLDCVEGKYFIRDDEDECVGWITFPMFPNLPQQPQNNDDS